MSNNIPQLGASGIYTLASPFDNQLRENVAYTCIAVRRLTDFTQVNRNPKILYYDANGLDSSIWERDSLDPEVCIITLVSKSGQWIYVPSSFITSFPDIGGIPYTVRLLGINLGAVPDNLDLSSLLTSVENIVRDTIGITSTCKTVAASDTKILSYQAHHDIEVARLNLIEEDKTDRGIRLDRDETILALRAQITALEDYIENVLTP